MLLRLAGNTACSTADLLAACPRRSSWHHSTAAQLLPSWTQHLQQQRRHNAARGSLDMYLLGSDSKTYVVLCLCSHHTWCQTVSFSSEQQVCLAASTVLWCMCQCSPSKRQTPQFTQHKRLDLGPDETIPKQQSHVPECYKQ